MSRALRFLAPSLSLLVSARARRPFSVRKSTTVFAYSFCFSLTVMTTACSGASHTGNAPAVCSM